MQTKTDSWSNHKSSKTTIWLKSSHHSPRCWAKRQWVLTDWPPSSSVLGQEPWISLGQNHWRIRSGPTSRFSLQPYSSQWKPWCLHECVHLDVKKVGKNFSFQVPSTAMHSSKTCPDERDRGFLSRPAQAGHQSWRGNPGLGVLFPKGTWSMIQQFNTLKDKIRRGRKS